MTKQLTKLLTTFTKYFYHQLKWSHVLFDSKYWYINIKWQILLTVLDYLSFVYKVAYIFHPWVQHSASLWWWFPVLNWFVTPFLSGHPYTLGSVLQSRKFLFKYHSFQVLVIWQIKSWFVLRILFTLYIIKVKAMEGWEYTPIGRGMGDHTPSQSMKSKKYYKVEIFDELWLLKSIF